MKKWKMHIPQGVQDFLPEECYHKTIIEEKIRKNFSLRGYNEIETPTLEYFDVFTEGKASIEQEQMFKIFEPGGRIVVLRPDITMPIARIAATKQKEQPLPLRLSYISSVYRYEELQSAKQREIPQAGIELLGVRGPEGDAEVIATAIETFMDMGLKEFQVDMGQVEFFKGLVEEAGLQEQEAEELRSMIDHKNMLALEMYLKELSISDNLKNLLMDLPKLYGNGNMLNEAAKLSKNPRCIKAIDNINEVYSILKDFGLEKYIIFDLGMVQSLNYYTGIIFRGITKELGYPVCGGGRYDNLVSEFGYDLPATGYAMGIKRVMMAIERQGGLESAPGVDVLVAYKSDSRKKGYEIVRDLRSKGKITEVFLNWDKDMSPEDYAGLKGIKEVIVID